MGQPKKGSDARQDVLRIRLSNAERKVLDDAAKAQTLDTSTWARKELLQLASKRKG